MNQLRSRGIDPDHLAHVVHQEDADALDLLLHVAYNAPLVTRRERAEKLRQKKANFFNTFTPAAKEILNTLLEKYADYGVGEFDHLSSVLQVSPFDRYGSTYEIYQLFGGAEKMLQAVDEMQKMLYEGVGKSKQYMGDFRKVPSSGYGRGNVVTSFMPGIIMILIGWVLVSLGSSNSFSINFKEIGFLRAFSLIFGVVLVIFGFMGLGEGISLYKAKKSWFAMAVTTQTTIVEREEVDNKAPDYYMRGEPSTYWYPEVETHSCSIGSPAKSNNGFSEHKGVLNTTTMRVKLPLLFIIHLKIHSSSYLKMKFEIFVGGAEKMLQAVDEMQKLLYE